MTAHFKGKLSLGTGHVTIKRKNIYNDAIQLYSTKAAIVDQVPILVQFDDEEGMDFGGVCRDFFSGFWEEAYLKMFDGAALLVPACHAGIDIKHFTVLGQILSHGYLLLWISSYMNIISCACFDIVGVVNQHFTRDICEIFRGIF